jgi:hypothetical protein
MESQEAALLASIFHLPAGITALRHERSSPRVRFSHLFPLHMFVSAARSAYASSRFWKPPVGTCLLHPRVRYLMGQVGGFL